MLWPPGGVYPHRLPILLDSVQSYRLVHLHDVLVASSHLTTPFLLLPRELGVDNPDEEVEVAGGPDGGDEVGMDAGASHVMVDEGGDDVERLYDLQHYDSEEG